MSAASPGMLVSSPSKMDVSFAAAGDAALDQVQPGRGRPERLDAAHLLRLVLAAPFGRDRRVRSPDDGIEDAGLHLRS